MNTYRRGNSGGVHIKRCHCEYLMHGEQGTVGESTLRGSTVNTDGEQRISSWTYRQYMCSTQLTSGCWDSKMMHCLYT